MPETTVRVQALSGNWETVGTDRSVGVWAEDHTMSANRWGPDTASFTIKRLPGSMNPDVRAFTPVEIEVAGVVVWDGFVWETPTTENGVTVNCRGWQYHLDDNVYQPKYLHTSLQNDWVDLRDGLRLGMPAQPAGSGSSGYVNIGPSALEFGWNKSDPINAGEMWCGVACDLSKLNFTQSGYGLDRVRRVIITLETANVGGLTFFARCIAAPSTGSTVSAASWSSSSSYTDGMSGLLTSFGAGPVQTFFEIPNTRGAFLQLFLYYNSGGAGTFSNHEWIRITDCRIASKQTERTTKGAILGRTKSILRASDVVKDAVRKTAPLIKVGAKDSAPPAYLDEVVADNPQRYYPLQQSGATQYNYINGSNFITFGGGYSVLSSGPLLDGASGVYNQSVDLNGSTNTGLDGTVPVKAAMSAEAWVKFDTLTGGVYKTILRQDTSFIVRVNTSNQWEFYQGNGTTWYAFSAGAPVTGRWYHVALRTDGVTVNGYVDGVYQGFATGAHTAQTANIYVGDSPTAGEKMDGQIAHVAWYDYALTEEQILNHYEAGRGRYSAGKVQRTSFPIPELWSQDPKTAREVIEGVNSFHDFQASVPVGRELQYRRLPLSPLYTASTSTPGIDFEDASANAGEDVYNRILVTGTDFDGSGLIREVRPDLVYDSTGSFVGYNSNGRLISSGNQFSNPSGEVDITGWTAGGGGGTIARTTTGGEYESGSGGIKASYTAQPSTSQMLRANFSGTFVQGATYTVRARVKTNTGSSRHFDLYLIDDWEGVPDSTNTAAAASKLINSNAAFQTVEWTFTAQRNLSGNEGSFRFDYWTWASGTEVFLIDTIEVYEQPRNMIAQRGFQRTKILPVEANVNTEAALKIGRIYADTHATVPFRGSLAVTSQEAVKRAAGGTSVQPSLLLLGCGELIRLSDVIDPDTGGLGRDGRIDSVTYTPADDKASVVLDSQRQRFEAMVARYAALSG